jgi:hypothetical protein
MMELPLTLQGEDCQPAAGAGNSQPAGAMSGQDEENDCFSVMLTTDDSLASSGLIS